MGSKCLQGDGKLSRPLRPLERFPRPWLYALIKQEASKAPTAFGLLSLVPREFGRRGCVRLGLADFAGTLDQLANRDLWDRI